MSLSKDEIKKIAWLARIAIDEQDVESYAKDLSSILEFVEQMNAVDASAVLAMAHPLDQVQRLRPDRVTEKNQSEYFQSQAAKVESNLYLVPKVIE